jgi:dienelactone hydrolase
VNLETNLPAEQPLYFERLALRVNGASPGETLTLAAELGTYRSEASFTASDTGVIDTSTDAPVSGDYADVDVDGFVWSMLPQGSGTQTFGDGTLHVELARSEVVLAQKDVQRVNVAPNVEKRTVPASEGFVGVVYVPEGPGPHPVIVGFGGSEGWLWFGDSIAATYASLGYVGVGVAYFGEATLPAKLTDVPLEYFQNVFDYVAKIPEADAAKIAVMGGSRGGELALLLGAHFSEVSAVVALVPSGLVWGSAGDIGAFAWTLDGTGLPFVPNAGSIPPTTKAPDGKDVYHLTPTFEASIAAATPAQLDAATIHVEDTNGPVLLIGGAADGLWPSCALADVSMERLVANGHTTTFADANVCYPDSGHFTNPLNAGYPMTTASLSYRPEYDAYYSMGGTPRGLGHAARQSFDTVKAFLDTRLR